MIRRQPAVPPQPEHLPNVVHLQRNEDGAWTNLPIFVLDHAKQIEWGDYGHGSADLALNILNWALLKRGFSGPRINVRQGFCFALAYQLHSDFKREIVAQVPWAGRSIRLQEVWDWIDNYDPERYEDVNR